MNSLSTGSTEWQNEGAVLNASNPFSAGFVPAGASESKPKNRPIEVEGTPRTMLSTGLPDAPAGLPDTTIPMDLAQPMPQNLSPARCRCPYMNAFGTSYQSMYPELDSMPYMPWGQVGNGSMSPYYDHPGPTATFFPGDSPFYSYPRPLRAPAQSRPARACTNVGVANANATANFWLGSKRSLAASVCNGNKNQSQNQNQNHNAVSTLTHNDSGEGKKRCKRGEYSWMQPDNPYGQGNSDNLNSGYSNLIPMGSGSGHTSTLQVFPKYTLTCQSQQDLPTFMNGEQVEMQRKAKEERAKEKKLADRQRKTEWQRRDRAKKREKKAEELLKATNAQASLATRPKESGETSTKGASRERDQLNRITSGRITKPKHHKRSPTPPVDGKKKCSTAPSTSPDSGVCTVANYEETQKIMESTLAEGKTATADGDDSGSTDRDAEGETDEEEDDDFASLFEE